MNIIKYIDLINNYKGTRLKWEKLRSVLAEDDPVKEAAFKTTNYDEFYQIVIELEKKGILYTKSNKTNKKPKPLKLTYYKYQESKIELTQEDKSFIHRLHQKIYKKNYLQQKEMLDTDRELLIKLNELLKNIDNECFMSPKERSYNLFKDEKLLQHSRILDKTKLSNEDVKCIENPYPLLNVITESFFRKEVRNVLVIENLDTYWSFHRAIMTKDKILDIDMLIYGQGYFFTDKKIDFSLYGISEKDKLLYFGDLDSEGIRIYLTFKEHFPELNVSLFKALYEKLLVEGDCNGYRYATTQKTLTATQLELLNSEIPSPLRENIQRIIGLKQFVPQEVINFKVIREDGPNWKI